MLKSHKMKVYYVHNSKDKKIPMIRISGSYLQEAGFDVGTSYEAEIKNGKIILSKA